VLASASPARVRLLTDAGVSFIADPAAIDEGRVKDRVRADGDTAEDAALALAEAKALAVAERHPAALVLGADQMLVCDGRWFDKPAGRAGAVEHLKALRGRTHTLISAVAAVEGGRVVWRTAGAAHLTMRVFDDAYIETYLDQCGAAVLRSVGAYHLEGLGAQLFERVDGDFFTVLGLPLLDVLAFLRGRNLL
jgi:septum formation protein